MVKGLRAALEVRHRSWLEPPILDRLRDAGVALCLHDWHECPVRDTVTADFVYVRRHGAGVRYGGSYRPLLLDADAAHIREWRAAGRDVYVYFNNDGGAFAVKNALDLRSRLATTP